MQKKRRINFTFFILPQQVNYTDLSITVPFAPSRCQVSNNIVGILLQCMASLGWDALDPEKIKRQKTFIYEDPFICTHWLGAQNRLNLVVELINVLDSHNLLDHTLIKKQDLQNTLRYQKQAKVQTKLVQHIVQ